MTTPRFGPSPRVVLAGTMLSACALLAGCGGSAASGNSANGGSRQTATGPSRTPSPSGLAVPDLNISDGNHLTPLTPGVEYQASLLRPLLRIAVPDAGWSGEQYVNKPFVNADLIKNLRDPAEPDGVVNVIADEPLLVQEYISEERALARQAAQPVTAGTMAGVPTMEYDSQAVGGDFVSAPEFTIPNGWRFHVIAFAVQNRTLVVVYSSPAANYAPFSIDARGVLATLQFPG